MLDIYDHLTSADMYSDGIHPNDTGYSIIAQQYLPALETAIATEESK